MLPWVPAQVAECYSFVKLSLGVVWAFSSESFWLTEHMCTCLTGDVVREAAQLSQDQALELRQRL